MFNKCSMQGFEGKQLSAESLLRMEPKRGIEPLTYALRVRCSTD